MDSNKAQFVIIMTHNNVDHIYQENFEIREK